MNTRGMFATVVATAVLVGCAATPKPVLTDVGYDSYVGTAFTINYCAEKGMLPPELAAKGIRYSAAAINRYVVDVVRFENEYKRLVDRKLSITQETCNRAAVQISAREQEITNNNHTNDLINRNNQEMLNSTKAINTYCNRIGTQTFCNTY